MATWRWSRVGGRAIAVEADLADASVVPRLFDEAERHLGPVDILIIGLTCGGPLGLPNEVSSGAAKAALESYANIYSASGLSASTGTPYTLRTGSTKAATWYRF